MKIDIILVGVLLAFTAIAPAFAAAPASFTVNFNQANHQWRGVSEFTDWTPGFSYLEYATSSDFVLSGNVLHTEWSYSPVVTELAGQSTAYVYDKASDYWIEKEGQVSYKYVAGYGDYMIANIFRGYLEFSGVPSDATFEHGVAYQWVYLFARARETTNSPLRNSNSI